MVRISFDIPEEVMLELTRIAASHEISVEALIVEILQDRFCQEASMKAAIIDVAVGDVGQTQ